MKSGGFDSFRPVFRSFCTWSFSHTTRLGRDLVTSEMSRFVLGDIPVVDSRANTSVKEAIGLEFIYKTGLESGSSTSVK